MLITIGTSFRCRRSLTLLASDPGQIVVVLLGRPGRLLSTIRSPPTELEPVPALETQPSQSLRSHTRSVHTHRAAQHVKGAKMAQVGASDITVNDVVAFLVELAAILALSAWGFRAGSGLVPKVLLGLGTPAAAIALWNMFAAPRSVFAVPAARLSVKVLVLGAAALASFTVGSFPTA